MNDRPPARRHRMSARGRQMLAAAYLPVFAFAAVLIAAPISSTRRHQAQAALR
jgi:hypothetical protein